MVDLQLVKANGWATVVTDVVKEITDHDPLFVDHFLELNKAVFAFEKKKKRKEKKRKEKKARDFIGTTKKKRGLNLTRSLLK